MEYLANIIVISTQIIVFQFFATGWGSRTSYKVALSKNPEWVASNPSFLKDFPGPKKIWVHYLLGILFLGLIVYGVITDTHRAFRNASLFSSLALAIQYFIIDLKMRKKIDHIIPSKDIRKASLNSRSIRSFFSLKILIPFVLVHLITIFAFIIFLIMGTEFSSVSNILILYVYLTVFISVCVFYILRRKRTFEDSAIDFGYRKMELYICGLVTVWGAVCVLMRLLYLLFEMQELIAWSDVLLYSGLLPIISFALFMIFSKRFFKICE